MTEYIFETDHYSFITGWNPDMLRYFLVIIEKRFDLPAWSSFEVNGPLSIEEIKSHCRAFGSDLPISIAWEMVEDKWGPPTEKCPDNGWADGPERKKK